MAPLEQRLDSSFLSWTQRSFRFGYFSQLGDWLVALMFPFALFPLGLEVVHFRPFGIPLGIVQGMFETAPLALLQTEEDETGKTTSSNSCYANANASLCATW